MSDGYFSMAILMMREITILIEKGNYGDWLKVYIPYPTSLHTFVSIQNSNGEIVRQVNLKEGNNAIDICNIKDAVVDVKVTTPYETVLRKININHLLP